LHEIDPDLSHTLFVPFESNGNRFFKSTALKTGTQNSLVCANIGEQITLTSYIHNRINSDTPVSLIDNISVHRTGMTCTLQDRQYEDISCLRQLQTVAEVVGFNLTPKTLTNYYTELLQNYTGRTLYVIINSHGITLDPSAKVNTICQPSHTDGHAIKDKLTVTMKTKYFSHLITLMSSVLDSLETQVHALQRLYILSIQSNNIQYYVTKPLSDICAALRKMSPSLATVNTVPGLGAASSFLSNLLDNSQLTTSAFTLLDQKISSLCPKQANDILIRKLYNAYLVFTLNVKTYLTTVVKKISPSTVVSLPSNIPLLLPASLTDDNIKNIIYALIRIQLDPWEQKMLIITLENEKTSLIHSLRKFLPATTQLPRFLSDADISDTRDTVPKQYTIHPEFTPAPRTLSRPNTLQATRRPYDITQAPQHQHDQPLTSEQPHILKLDLITPEYLSTTTTTTSTTPVVHEF
jgi:hypothetical protein